MLTERLHDATYESDMGLIRKDGVCQGLPNDLEVCA